LLSRPDYDPIHNANFATGPFYQHDSRVGLNIPGEGLRRRNNGRFFVRLKEQVGAGSANNRNSSNCSDYPEAIALCTTIPCVGLVKSGRTVTREQTESMEKTMQLKRPRFLVLLIGTLVAVSFGAIPSTRAATPEDLNKDADQALHRLTSTNPFAADLSKKAKAVLIFPNIVKAGLIFGGAYGEGVLKEGSKVDGYYNSVTASWGLQAGAQSYGYVVFLMSNKAIKYLHDTHGLEIGTGPTVVVVNEGVAKNLSTSSLKDDAYAFIFDQQGLMASLSIEGTKISRIRYP